MLGFRAGVTTRFKTPSYFLVQIHATSTSLMHRLLK